jgi:hypothetical protein
VTEVPLTNVYESKVGDPFTFKLDPVKSTAPELVIVIRFCSRFPATVIAPTSIPLEDLLNLNVAPLLNIIGLATGKLPEAPTTRVPLPTVVAPL